VNGLDWFIVGAYMAAMVGMALWVGRGQREDTDYYLGGYRLSYWSIALSTMATQCSTNSLLGAPAFVIAVGGLLWLQYELALPLAMIAVMHLLLPLFRSCRLVSVYEYLERRFGRGTRVMLSVLFQLLRAFSTGVTVYGIALVIQVLTGMPFWGAVLLLGSVTVLYDFLGGMRAVVYSDVVQMAVLYAGIAVCLLFAVRAVGGWAAVAEAFPAAQRRTLDLAGTGLRHGETFAFWPMLLGGLFLYMGYYGCDQTQVQRELSARSVRETNLSLFVNGLLRFPLVVTYCAVGVAIGAYAAQNPGFLDLLRPEPGAAPNVNLAVPVFCVNRLPHGVIGLIMVSLFAAAMSSLDSTINSLSAATVRDLLAPSGRLRGRAAWWLPRLTTVFWGVVCVGFAFTVGGIAPSIIESINKIASLANGPILGTFLLGTLTVRASNRGAMAGIAAGFAANLLTAALLPGVSWLWWNVIGCAVTMGLPACRAPAPPDPALVLTRETRRRLGQDRRWYPYYAVLAGWFACIVTVLAVIGRLWR
jgi:SSS family transporter